MPHARNNGTELDLSLIANSHVNLNAIERRAASHIARRSVKVSTTQRQTVTDRQRERAREKKRKEKEREREMGNVWYTF
jgi:hypothetical protein